MVAQATRGYSIPEKLDYYTYPEPNTGCWLWGGVVDPSGYGNLSLKNKKVAAHRLSWERHNGPIPKGLCVLHKCDVPTCINPEHLFLGTRTDNMRDAVRKGRMSRGESSKCAKLTEINVLAILKDCRSSRVIGEEYGVSHTAIYQIKNGKTWQHLNPTPPKGQ